MKPRPETSDLIRKIAAGGWFISSADTKCLLADPATRDLLVLVRTNLDRFLCRLPELEDRIAQIKTRPGDYLRDVSAPASSVAMWRYLAGPSLDAHSWRCALALAARIARESGTPDGRRIARKIEQVLGEEDR